LSGQHFVQQLGFSGAVFGGNDYVKALAEQFGLAVTQHTAKSGVGHEQSAIGRHMFNTLCCMLIQGTEESGALRGRLGTLIYIWPGHNRVSTLSKFT
jgi:hypothetical protein